MARTVDRKKLAEWQRRFARHRTSGLTVAEFCRREGIEAGRWKYWQRQVERLTATEPGQAAARAVFHGTPSSTASWTPPWRCPRYLHCPEGASPRRDALYRLILRVTPVALASRP